MTLRPVADGPGRTSKYPDLGGGTLGLYWRQPPDFEQITVATAASGPNQGLSYVLSIPGIPASLINLTLALFPGDPWYNAHPDSSGIRNDLGELICTKRQIDGLRLQIERHEGTTMASNSHYGIDQDLLRRWKLGTYMGSRVISVQGSAEQIRQRFALDFAAEWRREDAALKPLDQAFDATDIPAIYNSLGCSIFLKS